MIENKLPPTMQIGYWALTCKFRRYSHLKSKQQPETDVPSNAQRPVCETLYARQ